MDFVHPKTALAGLSYAGVAVAGIYGVYSEVPEDPENPGNPINPDDEGFPGRESLNLVFSLNGSPPAILRGSFTWSLSSGSEGTSSASGTIITESDDRPRAFMSLRVGIGSLNHLLWSGIITSVDSTHFGGIDTSREFQYQINAVGWYHYTVRKQISIGKHNCYASDIIRTILNTYMSEVSIGTINRGRYYSHFSEKEQQISSILQKLAQESECTWYIDQNKQFHFLETNGRTMPFQLSYTPTWNFGWDVPDNNFNNVKVSEQGEQVVTRLFLHGSNYVEHTMRYKWRPSGSGLVTYASNTTPITVTLIMPGSLFQYHGLSVGDTVRIEGVEGNTGANGTWSISAVTNNTATLSGSIGDGVFSAIAGRWFLEERASEGTQIDGEPDTFSWGQMEYYALASGQRQFMTEFPIAYINSIAAEWIYYRPDGSTVTHRHRWYDPMRGFRDGNYILGTSYIDINEQFSYLEAMGDSQIDIYKSQIRYPENIFRYWKPASHIKPVLNWELSPDESGRSVLEALIQEEDPPLTGVQEEEALDFPFDWEIGYGSNNINFIANIETTDAEEVDKIKFINVEINYVQREASQNIYTDRSQIAIIKAYDGDSDGLIDSHVYEEGLVTKAQKEAYRDAFFALRSEPRLSVSYTHLIEGNGIFNQPIYPGMTQAVTVHGQNTDLMVESVSYNILNSKVPVLEVNIQLATKQRDLAGLVQRLLRRT